MYCGIDFGTSNSTIGIQSADGPTLVALEDGKNLLPSAIFFSEEEEGEVFIGRAAIDEYVARTEGRFMRSIKSALGTSLIEEKTRVGRRGMTLGDVVKVFLTHAKRTAEAALGEELTQVVEGRPVRFTKTGGDEGDAKAQAQLDSILREIGFKDIVFEYEPVAAARCIDGLSGADRTVLVADIGGGTSDFTVVRFDASDRQGRVLANHGIRLGGTDFDYALNFKHIQPLFGRGMTLNATGLVAPSWLYRSLSFWPEINTAYNAKTFDAVRWMAGQAAKAPEVARLQTIVDERFGHRVALDVEAAKIALSTAELAQIDFGYVEAGLTPELARTQLQEAVAEDLSDLRAAIAQSCVLAGIDADRIDMVLMTGGSTGMPAVEQAILSSLPEATPIAGDRMAAVGRGLTLKAAEVFG